MKHEIDRPHIGKLLSGTDIVWLDDGQIEDLHTRKFYDRAQPRVEMTVEAAERDVR